MPLTLAQLTNPAVLRPELMDPMTAVALAVKRAKLKREKAAEVQAGIPQTDDELWTYVEKTWGVQIPRVKVCDNHVAPFTAFADAYFARNSMIIWEASRGLGGKSFMLSILGLTIATTRGGDVNILGGSGEQSKRVHDYMSKAWQKPEAPRDLLRSDPMKTVTKLAKGNTIQALLASSTSVRGSHIPTLLLDEIDEMDIAIFDAAMGQTMAMDGHPPITVMSSTHHYPDGTMTELKRRAKDKHYPIMSWCFRESLEPHGWLTQATVAQKQYETTSAMWNAEFELQEPSPENRAIMTEAVRYMFQRELGEYEGRAREYIEHEAPEPGARYTHGADWARSQDFTEIVTLRTDVTAARLVAYERMQRLPWPQMVKRFEDRITRYGVNQGCAAHDGTGLGDVIDGYLTMTAEKVIMAGRARSDLFSNYINAIEKGAIVSPYIEALHGQHLYVTVDDLYGSGHPPDGFIAGALAWHARGSQDPGITF
jgi:hypothetical protein